MTDTSPADRYAWRASAETRDEETRSDALARHRAKARNAGWLQFATAMLMLIGVFQIVTGLSVLLRRETFLLPESRLALAVDYAAYGWVYIVLGVLAFVLVIYAITVHGGRDGTRFYADRA